MTDARGRVHGGKCAAGRRCTSFRAELAALIKQLDDLVAGQDDAAVAPVAEAARAAAVAGALAVGHRRRRALGLIDGARAGR